MALFPAYKIENEPTTSKNEDEQDTWLKNSSFQPVNIESLKKKPTEERRSKHRKKKKHELFNKNDKAIRKSIGKLSDENEEFILDTKRTKEFLTVNTISRPSAPKYHSKYRILKTFYKMKEKKKFKRYYRALQPSKDIEEERSKCFDEREFTEATSKYNKKLSDNPHDVKLWLEFINYQDTLHQYEKTYKKGSIAKAQRNLADRKLLILDKALIHNPNNDDLHRERLRIAVNSFPLDELQLHLKHLVDKEPNNLILWQGYIESSQCSMSQCNIPAVLKLYTKCLSILHQLRRNAIIEKHLLEESILRMLYKCGLFMKQAGLFEQLWTLLRLYLELNLFQSNKYEPEIDLLDKQLMELEDVVFKSNLPLHELWLRIEKLREACHWLPIKDNVENCEDPQRIVLIEDVSELIHPITRPENVFKLYATILTLLKVPLLPCRHVTMQNLGLDYVPWALDTIEPILATFYPNFPLIFNNDKSLSINFQHFFTNGPQYIKLLPGQEEYLTFLLNLMKTSANYLTNNDQTACIIWFIRFLHLLLILNKQGKFKITLNLTKMIKQQIKDLLKIEQYRNNELFYCEYALIELDLNNDEDTTTNSLGILMKTIKMCKKNNGTIQTSNFNQSQIVKTHLYRTLIEILINSNDYSKAKQVFCEFLECAQLEECERKFKLITLQLMESDFNVKNDIVEHFLPNFYIDFVILNGWFIYITKSALYAGEFIEIQLNKLQNKQNAETVIECLYEFYTIIMFKHCIEYKSSFQLIDDVLNRALELFPNNLYLLNLCVKQQSLVIGCLGKQFWPIKNLLLKTGRLYAVLFAIFIGLMKLQQIEENLMDTISGESYKVDKILTNQILALFKRATKMDTKRCGLIWRLYLHFVYNYYNAGMCRNVYYTAVEECPWLKSLYVDAAVYIPAELAQIQDLIIEKQLRLHVTPEELDVLRG